MQKICGPQRSGSCSNPKAVDTIRNRNLGTREGFRNSDAKHLAVMGDGQNFVDFFCANPMSRGRVCCWCEPIGREKKTDVTDFDLNDASIVDKAASGEKKHIIDR